MSLVGHKIETTSANFGGLVQDNCLLVDKTLMIKEFFDGQKVSLITRPRRFGKTLSLSMLQHFFSATVTGKSTDGLFNAFLIAKEDNGQFIEQHQGQYPVIFVTFKDTKEPSLNSTIRQLRNLMQELYREHQQLLLSDKMTINDKAMFQKYLEGSVHEEELQAALRFLSEALSKVHGKNVIILIDEYDTPLTNAYHYEFLDVLSDFMRDLFSSALKDNPYLERGLMTGILRVSKNNMLSGLNNLEIYTLLDQQYATYFGFTEKEVNELIHYTQNDVNVEKIKAYYNGYQIGGAVIYNPWSTMKFLHRKELAPYWVLTSNDDLLKNNFLNSSDDTKAKLGDLMQGKCIMGKVEANLRYEELLKNPDALWTLLLFCGYLTVERKEREYSRFICQLKIPNEEILAQYREIFSDWLEKSLGETKYSFLLSSLITGNVDSFTKSLGDYLMDALSFRDTGGGGRHKPMYEHFYHGLIVGLIASIRDTHWVDSNKESGRGLYDVLLTPKNPSNFIGIVLEFKRAKTAELLPTAAANAVKQIERLAYGAVLKRSPHIKQILKIGLAFCEKAVIAAYQTEDILTGQSNELAWGQTYCRNV